MTLLTFFLPNLVNPKSALWYSALRAISLRYIFPVGELP